MALQDVILTIDDPGIGRAVDARVIPWLIGTADQGSTTVAASFGRPTEVIDTYGGGPLVVAAAHVLRKGGRPVRLLRVPSNADASIGAVTQVGAGPVMTVTGTVNDEYAVRAEVTRAGGEDVGRIRYTLDAYDEDQFPATFVGDFTIDLAAGEVILVGTGMTLVFGVAVDLVLGTTYSFTTTPPHYGATDIATAFTIIEASGLSWRFASFIGHATTIATALTDLAAIRSGIEALFAEHRYVLGMGGVGRDNPAVTIAAYDFVSIDVSTQFGHEFVLASVPIAGRVVSKVSKMVVAAARAAASFISTDLSRTATGPLKDVVGIDHDEFILASGLDDERISTSRTYVEQPGFYFSNIYMASLVTSDFQFWQHALTMRIGCQVVFDRMFKYLSASLRTAAGGVLDAADAADIDADVNQGLTDALLRPLNAEGNRGHASAAIFAVDDDVDVLTSGELTGELAVQPLFYPKIIRVRLGFRRIL